MATRVVYQARATGAVVTVGWPTFAFALVALGLPTSVYVFCADRFEFLGPRINLDLLLICIAGIVIARRAPRFASAFVILGLIWALLIQFALGLGAIYVDDPALIAEYLPFARFWPWRLIATWLIVAGVALAMIYAILRRIRLADAHFMPFLLLLIVFGSLDLVARTPFGYGLVGDNVATSSTVRALKLVRQWSTGAAFHAAPIDSPMMVRTIETANVVPPRVMSLSVEALGLFRDERVNDGIVVDLRGALGRAFTVEVGRHAFKGATLSGEMRELCNMRTSGTPHVSDVQPFHSRCLPALLAGRGYETLGVHGNSGFFYNRIGIYPAVGFAHALFYEDLTAGSKPAHRCKTRAFEGVCDTDAVAVALRHIAQPGRRYAHVMTLDTHFPLGATTLGDDRCGRFVGLTDADLCLYANQMANLLAGIGRQVARSPVPPDVVYVFGDHAPPYVVAAKRRVFDREAVPFLVIRRKAQAGAGAGAGA